MAARAAAEAAAAAAATADAAAAAEVPAHMASWAACRDAVASGAETFASCARGTVALIGERNGELACFVQVADADEAAGADGAADGGAPLAGMTVCVKDVLDVRGMCTAFGCAAPISYIAEEDAHLVRQLRRAGAVVMGKSVTCELAGGNPSPARNPRGALVTPGGSSSGSAAAVGARLCHLGIGTQTGGSIVRPASFCGAFAIKPTFQLLSRHTCLSTCPSLDTLGFMANSLGDLSAALAACAPSLGRAAPPETVRVGVVRDPVIVGRAEASTLALLDGTAALLSEAGFAVGVLEADIGIARALELHRVVGGFELHFKNDGVCTRFRSDVSERAKHGHRRGAGYTAAEYFAAVEEVDGRLRASFRRLLEEYDCLLLPSATGEAPPLEEETTGDPVFNSPTTLLGFPAVTMPLYLGPRGLPVGMQVMGAPLDDLRLLGMAERIWSSVRRG